MQLDYNNEIKKKRIIDNLCKLLMHPEFSSEFR